MTNRKLEEINRSIMQRLVSGGKITIPNEIREIYDIQDGDMLEVLIIGFYRNDGHNENYQPEGDEESRKP